MNKNKRPVCVCVFHVIVTVSPPRHTLDASGDDASLFFFFRFRFQSLSGYQETSEGDLFVGLSIDKQVMISQTETLSRPSFD